MSAPLLFHDGRVTLHHGDCLDVLDALPENSVDSCVVDPPYHLHSITKRFAKTGRTESTRSKSGPHQRTGRGFMSQLWDGGDIAFTPVVWRKVLRVLKPGAYLLAFASTKGFGRMSVAIEDAGFVTHPLIGDLFDGSADVERFCRSLSAEQAGAFATLLERRDPVAGLLAWVFGQGFAKATRLTECALTGPMAGLDVDGLRYGGQSLKPCLEPIYMGQKPFSEPTGTANVLKWGTGAVNVDDCRIGTDDDLRSGACQLWSHRRVGEASAERRYHDRGATNSAALPGVRGGSPLGRWPAGLVHDGSPAVVAGFPQSAGQFAAVGPKNGAKSSVNTYGDYGARHVCEPRGDSGSAARFFHNYGADLDRFVYESKADADDRLGSGHPTVKDIDLVRWLVRLVTPKGGVCLDCFAGTGTTGHAALIEGCRAVLIEREAQYVADIERRMGLVFSGREERRGKLAKQAEDHGPLFGGAA